MDIWRRICNPCHIRREGVGEMYGEEDKESEDDEDKDKWINKEVKLGLDVVTYEERVWRG